MKQGNFFTIIDQALKPEKYFYKKLVYFPAVSLCLILLSAATSGRQIFRKNDVSVIQSEGSALGLILGVNGMQKTKSIGCKFECYVTGH